MANIWKIDTGKTDQLITDIQRTGARAEQIISGVMQSYAGNRIIEKITPILPESGRKWKGKRKAARQAQPLRTENKDLSVIVRSKSPYHYLYFPDDGSNTVHHHGDQRFMYRGAEAAVPDIIEQCITEITEEIGG